MDGLWVAALLSPLAEARKKCTRAKATLDARVLMVGGGGVRQGEGG